MSGGLAGAAAKKKQSTQRLVDRVAIGDKADEARHNFQSKKSNSGSYGGKVWRDGRSGGWFSYDLKLPADQPATLMCTYWGSDSRRTFDIMVDGTKLVTETLRAKKPGKFLDVEYKIPAKLTRGKKKVTVKFQSPTNSVAGGVFGCAMLKGQ